MAISRVHTFFQKQISVTFPGLKLIFQGLQVHINPYTPKISMLILLTTFHTLHIFKLSLTDFWNFPGPVSFFQDFPGLENARIKFQDFPGFPGPVRTLISPGWWFSFLFSLHVCLNMYWYCLEKLDFNLSREYNSLSSTDGPVTERKQFRKLGKTKMKIIRLYFIINSKQLLYFTFQFFLFHCITYNSISLIIPISTIRLFLLHLSLSILIDPCFLIVF